MIKHLTAACLLGTALVATPVMAQSSSTQSTAPAMNNNGAATSSMKPQTASGEKFLTQMTANQWRGSKLIGVDVYGSENAKIGDINEVVVNHDGSIQAVVIGVGGFLGIGEKDVAIPFQSVQWGSQDKAMTTSATAPAENPGRTGNMAQTTTNSANNAARGATRETTSMATSNTMNDYPARAMVNMTKDQLKNAPAFKYASQVKSDTDNKR